MNKKPTKTYYDYLNFYKQMHNSGFLLKSGESRNYKNAYDGSSTLGFIKSIKKIIEKNSINSLLDYGCGKAILYENEFKIGEEKIKSLKKYWGIKTNLYDPAYKKFSELPKGKFDLTISIDVMEHIPETDIDWVLEEIFSITNKFIFFNVACFEANALLPNGQNAHTLVKKPKWWFNKFIEFKKRYTNMKIVGLCAERNTNNDGFVYIPINIDDNINNYK